jgi:hypothetical protein
MVLVLGAITGVTTKDNPARGNNFLIARDGDHNLVVTDFDPTQPGAPSVAPGDSLYFLRDNGERDVRVKAVVVRVAALVSSPERDLAQALKELQAKLQLDEAQYCCWSAREQALLVEFESAHKISVIHVAPDKITDRSDWIVFEDFR